MVFSEDSTNTWISRAIDYWYYYPLSFFVFLLYFLLCLFYSHLWLNHLLYWRQLELQKLCNLLEWESLFITLWGNILKMLLTASAQKSKGHWVYNVWWHISRMWWTREKGCWFSRYTLVHSKVYCWFTLVHLSTLWYTLVHYSILWYTLVHTCTLWYTLVQPNTLWYTLVNPCTLWYTITIVHSGILWFNLVLSRTRLKSIWVETHLLVKI